MTGIIFLIWAMLCQNPNHNLATPNSSTTQVTTMDANGDTGHVPPKPPTPPTP